MGQFSWIASDSKRPVLDNVHGDVYLLIPAKFGGNYYHTNYYDGYGNIGIDVYDAVVDWNKDYLAEIIEKKKKPKLEDYSDKLGWFERERLEEKLGRKLTEEETEEEGKKQQQEYYKRALSDYEFRLLRARDYSIYSDEHMKQKYGDDYKRTIGIDIACYDKDNASLPYPIKIVHKANMSYEQALPSMSDPDQGWGFAYDEDSDLTEEEQAEEYLQNVANEVDKFINDYYTKYKVIGDELRKGKE